jgi:transcriptional regulator with XRE-family HTH domain
MQIGEKVKDLRLVHRITIKELSQKSGVSKSLLSQIERNISVPTVTTLQKIASAFGMPISHMFPENNGAVHEGAPKESDTKVKGLRVVRRGHRKKIVMPWGGLYEMLCPDLRHKIEFIYLHYPVGAKAQEFYSHEGEECGVVLEGEFKGVIGDETVVLGPGDSIYYDSSIPHRWQNVGETEVQAIWAITPPSF